MASEWPKVHNQQKWGCEHSLAPFSTTHTFHPHPTSHHPFLMPVDQGLGVLQADLVGDGNPRSPRGTVASLGWQSLGVSSPSLLSQSTWDTSGGLVQGWGRGRRPRFGWLPGLGLILGRALGS